MIIEDIIDEIYRKEMSIMKNRYAKPNLAVYIDIDYWHKAMAEVKGQVSYTIYDCVNNDGEFIM